VRKPSAAAGSALFFAVAPGVVAGLIPYGLTGWETGGEWWLPLRVLGGLLTAAAAAVLVHAFARFVSEGLGTPAPAAPTEHLVVGGLYRYVRNVMYIAVTTAILGQALLLGQSVLLAYGALMWAVMAAFVKLYEEPTLADRYGAQYEEYRRAVPAWWPRLSGGRSPSSSPSRRGSSQRRP
jgi:protein-S-isoprenylcysteine O-methyltransferase Ste14